MSLLFCALLILVNEEWFLFYGIQYHPILHNMEIQWATSLDLGKKGELFLKRSYRHM